MHEQSCQKKKVNKEGCIKPTYVQSIDLLSQVQVTDPSFAVCKLIDVLLRLLLQLLALLVELCAITLHDDILECRTPCRPAASAESVPAVAPECKSHAHSQ